MRPFRYRLQLLVESLLWLISFTCSTDIISPIFQVITTLLYRTTVFVSHIINLPTKSIQHRHRFTFFTTKGYK